MQSIQKKIKHLRYLALVCLCLIATGVNSCSEQKEFCLHSYETQTDQIECSNFCESNKTFESKTALIQACWFGQASFLSSEKLSSANAVLLCDRQYKDDNAAASACREGALAEELRTSKVRKGSGSASDRADSPHRGGTRETGN